MKTAKNIALDYLRKSKNRVPVIDLDTALDMLSEDPFSDVSWILEEKEKSEFLKRALFRMKIEHNNWYEVILMSYVQRMDNISIGNALQLTKEEYEYIYNKLGTVVNTGLAPVQSLTVDIGNTLTEEDVKSAIPKVDALYSDGSIQSFNVDWTDSLKNVDFSKEGTYTITGQVIQKKYVNKLKELNNSVLSEDDPDNANLYIMQDRQPIIINAVHIIRLQEKMNIMKIR